MKKKGYNKIELLYIQDTLMVMDREKDTESKYSRMEINTKVPGLGTKPMEKENSGTQMAIIMKDFGLMTRLMDRAFTHLRMAQAILVNGKTICRMVMAKKPGPINHHMKAHTIWAVNKEEDSTSMQTAQFTTENGRIIRSMELEPTPGKTTKFTRASGKWET